MIVKVCFKGAASMLPGKVDIICLFVRGDPNPGHVFPKAKRIPCPFPTWTLLYSSKTPPIANPFLNLSRPGTPNS